MRKRLFAVAVTALLPAVGLLAYNEVLNRRQRSAEVTLQAAQAARYAASEVEQILEGARSLLVAVSALPTVIDLDPQACAASLMRVSQNLTMTGAILVIDAQGKLVCDSQGNPAGTDFSDRSYVRDGLAATDMVVGSYTVSKLTGAAVLPLAFPLRRGSDVVGVVATGIKLDWLQARIKERGLTKGGAVTLADRSGVILAREPFPDRFVGTRIPPEFRYLLNEDAPGTMEVLSQDGSERIMGYRPITPRLPVYVSAGLSKTEAFQDIDRTAMTGITMLVAGIALAFVAASWVGNRFILVPIFRIVQVLEDWKGGRTESRTRMEGHYAELGLVGGSVDRLLDELEVRSKAAELAEERRNLLAGELTHRVKNTLAVVNAIARQTFPRDERLKSYSERLTALGRAYDLLFSRGPSHPQTHIADVVKATLQPYADEMAERFKVDGPACDITPEAGLSLSLVVHELATNATKYGSLSNDMGHVCISWECQDGRVSFSWVEVGGPPVRPPTRTGFGSQLIRRAFSASYKPDLSVDYADEGLKCLLVFSQTAQIS